MVGEGEPGEHSEVVARPNAVDRLVEHCAAVGDVQARTVDAAAYEDVIDPTAELEGHLAGSDQRVRWREGCTGICRMDGRPGVSVADAHLVQGLTSGPEPEAG
jgi:hypothetical protein